MKWRAFTLIELLVVIAIIALLTAILVPTLRRSKENANAIVCSSNIKQLVLGLTLYESNNGTFPYAFYKYLKKSPPPPGGFPGNAIFDRMGWWWFNYIADYSEKYLDKDSILWCPSRQIKEAMIKYDVLCGNYGVNQSVCKCLNDNKSPVEFTGQPLSNSEISNPSRTLLVFDSGYSMINWRHATDSPPEPLGNSIEDAAYVPGLGINHKKKLWPGLEDDAVRGRHANKTVNIGFVDGHFGREKADKLLVEKTSEIYTNKVPLWQPE
jgi:prepilin-type N-terminal cleavage/methylation domain-containing protein/prepilin-type processing-associated H-X9-DG protein